MKKIITIVAAMVLILAFVTAYADEMPTMTTESKDIGNMLYLDEAPGHAHVKRIRGDLLYTPQDVLSPTARKDFSGPVVAETPIEVGTALYNSAFETKLAEDIIGSAAGGGAKEDENTRIWNNLLSVPGGSDELP